MLLLCQGYQDSSIFQCFCCFNIRWRLLLSPGPTLVHACACAAVVVSLQDGWCYWLSPSPRIHTSRTSYVHCTMVDHWQQQNVAEMLYNSQYWVIKDGFLLRIPVLRPFRGKPPVPSWKHRHSLSRGPRVEKLNPLASSQQGTEAYEPPPSVEQLLQPPEKLWAKITQPSHRNCNVVSLLYVAKFGSNLLCSKRWHILFLKRDFCLSEKQSAFGLRVH